MFMRLRLITRGLASDAAVARAVQWLCFATAPILMLVALSAVTRLAGTPGEVVLGVIGAGTMALLVVVIGLVVPLARREA